MSGYFQSDRNLAQAFLPKHGDRFSELEAYIFLTSFAAYAPREQSVGAKLISLNVGELVASERYLQSRWGWSRTKVRNFKGVLKKRGLLDQREDQQETILILYCKRDSEPLPDKKKTTKQTRGEPAKNHPETKLRRKKKGERKEESLTLPFDSDDFKFTWNEWIQHLKEKRKSPTPSTKSKQLKTLSSLSESDAIATINQSITNGWMGLFPLNERTAKTSSRTEGTCNEAQLFGAGKNPNQPKPFPTL